LTVSASVPALSDPAGILTVALPLLRVAADEVYPPPVSVTDPVGVGLPLPPFTVAVTDNACAVVMLLADGVTVIVGAILATVTVAAAEAEL
jgi:hypothetical protein